MRFLVFRFAATVLILFGAFPALAEIDTPAPPLIGAFRNLRIINQIIGWGDTQQPPKPEELIARYIRAILGLTGIVLVVLIIYGGYLWGTAGGNEERVTQAQKLIRNAVIGVIIIFGAYVFTAFVVQRAGEALFEPLLSE